MNSSQNSSELTRKASKEVLKVIYYVIIALAITESLDIPFLLNFTTFYLFIAFLVSICRFAHGASIHLDVILGKRYKPLFDFVEFFFQGALFYLMAKFINDPSSYSLYFSIMLFSDAIWLIILRLIKYIKLDNTHMQWIISDVIIIIILLISSLLILDDYCISGIIMIISIIATILDYVCNRDFYFPPIKNKIK